MSLARAALLAFALAWGAPARALSVEVLAGNVRASVDTMFYVFLPRARDRVIEPSRFLLFQRVRGSVGYDAADPSDAPSFGITTAVSWNPPALRGFAPVLVGQLLDGGPKGKAGVQFVRATERFVAFSWLVCEIAAGPTVDAFVLLRYTAPVADRLGVSLAAEALVGLPTDPDDPFSVVERVRLGLVRDGWQLGPGLDLAQFGRAELTTTFNVGAFVRLDL